MFRHRLEEKERKIYIPPLPLLRMSLHTKWKNVHHVQRTVYIFLLGNVFLTFSPDAYASSSIFARNERLLVPVYIRISNSEDASGEIRTTFLFLFPPIFMPFYKFLLPSQEQNSPLVDRWSNVFHYIFSPHWNHNRSAKSNIRDTPKRKKRRRKKRLENHGEFSLALNERKIRMGRK